MGIFSAHPNEEYDEDGGPRAVEAALQAARVVPALGGARRGHRRHRGSNGEGHRSKIWCLRGHAAPLKCYLVVGKGKSTT